MVLSPKAVLMGKVIPVIISVYKDKSFDFIIKTPPVAVQIMEAAKIKKGSAGFTSIAAEQTKEGLFYRTNGMGLKHFFYRSGRFLIWWQADPDKADKTFQNVHTFKFGE